MVWLDLPGFEAKAKQTTTGQTGLSSLHELLDFSIFDGTGDYPVLAAGDVIRISRLRTDVVPVTLVMKFKDSGAPDVAGLQLAIGLAYDEEDAYPEASGDTSYYSNYFCSVNVDGATTTSRVDVLTTTLDCIDVVRSRMVHGGYSISDVWKSLDDFKNTPVPTYLDLVVKVVSITTSPSAVVMSLTGKLAKNVGSYLT